VKQYRERNVSVIYRQVLFYARVTFLKNIMQIEHKNPTQNSVPPRRWEVDNLILHTASGHTDL
jgi:hypothetical protein